MSNIVEINDGNWESEVMQSNVPVIVDFWAEWCGPCKVLKPLIESVAVEMGDKIKIASVDVEKNMGLASTYSIRSVPTILVMKNGKSVDRKIGALNKNALLTLINPHVNL